MDFSDYTTTMPAVANPDYSPVNESFAYPDTLDKVYVADSYTTSNDHSLASFFDCDSYYDRPLSSVELPAPGAFAPKDPAVFNAALPAATPRPGAIKTSSSPAYDGSAPFGQLEPFPSGFSFEANPFDTSVSPLSQHSRTPSLCGDAPPPWQAPSSPELSPRLTLKREPTDEAGLPDEEPLPKRAQRKRGRPRLDRSASEASSTSSKCQRTSRLPHNQVERKYREGLNSELERLRRAVPTLPQTDEGNVMGQPKPSKAMVLAGAIEYIKKIERERDLYRVENERLRSLGQHAWGDTRSDPVSDFLVDL